MHPEVRHERFVRLASLVALSLIYWTALLGHKTLGLGDHLGWWGWFDQGMYIRPVAHFHGGGGSGTWFYQPLYTLAAIPFGRLARLVSQDLSRLDAARIGFYALDYVLFMSSAALTGALGRRIGIRYGEALWLLLALVCREWLETFVIPWTSSFTVPLILGSYIVVVSRRFDLKGFAWLFAIGAGIVLSRPSDLFAVLPAGAFYVVNLARPLGLVRTAIVCVAAAVAGLGLMVLWGWWTGVLPFGPYLAGATTNGLRFDSLPFKTIALLNDSRDFGALAQSVRKHSPLIYTLLLAAILLPIGTVVRRGWKQPLPWIGASVLLFVLVAFAYNDLHPANLFQYLLLHYFKFVLPLGLLFIAEAVVYDLWRLVAVAIGIGLFSLVRIHHTADRECRRVEEDHFQCDAVRDARVLILKLDREGYELVLMGLHYITVDGTTYASFRDFRMFFDVGKKSEVVFFKPVSGRDFVFRLQDGAHVLKLERAVRTFP